MPIPSVEQGELLRRVVEAGREAARVEEPPEVVARVREVCGGCIGEAAGVDAAEDDGEPRSEHIRDGGGWGLRLGYAASGSRASRRASKASRIRSVSTVGGGASTRPAGRTLTASSLPLQP